MLPSRQHPFFAFQRRFAPQQIWERRETEWRYAREQRCRQANILPNGTEKSVGIFTSVLVNICIFRYLHIYKIGQENIGHLCAALSFHQSIKNTAPSNICVFLCPFSKKSLRSLAFFQYQVLKGAKEKSGNRRTRG